MVFKAVSGVTPVSNAFIEEYMPKAPSAMFSVIYIYGLKCACTGGSAEAGAIAERLGVLESDVVKAWKYWEKCGIVRITEEEGEKIIELLPVSAQKRREEEKPAPAENGAAQALKPAGTMPVYTAAEMKKKMDEIPELSQLIKSAESVNGKPLGHSETGLLIGFHTWLGLPFEVIAMLITYCVGKPFSYMEKTAMDWASKGISTADEAEQYINAYHSGYREILKCFGQNGRNPVEWELVYMNSWLFKIKMPLPLIKEACSRAMKKIGRASESTYSYADAILQAWNKNEVRSMGELDAYDKAYREKTEAERAAKNAANAERRSAPQIKPTAFSNYEQPVYSDEELSDILERKKKRMKK